MLPFRCLGCTPRGRFYADSPEALPLCPECGSARRVHALVVIHLLKPDPNGSVAGSAHAAHERYSISCGVKKAGQMTDHPPAATCYNCVSI